MPSHQLTWVCAQTWLVGGRVLADAQGISGMNPMKKKTVLSFKGIPKYIKHGRRKRKKKKEKTKIRERFGSEGPSSLSKFSSEAKSPRC